MIKTWQERIVTANPPYVDPEEINKAMLEEIDELRADAARYREALVRINAHRSTDPFWASDVARNALRGQS